MPAFICIANLYCLININVPKDKYIAKLCPIRASLKSSVVGIVHEKILINIYGQTHSLFYTILHFALSENFIVNFNSVILTVN